MRHAVKHLHFVGMVAVSCEQGSRLRDASAREGRQMPTDQVQTGTVHA